MTAADRARRERGRLLSAAVKAQRKREHAFLIRARVRERIAELDRELKAAADGLAELDRLDPAETGLETTP